MPGQAGSQYWAAVDFDSEGDEEHQPPQANHRVYLDPWDNEGYGLIQGEVPESNPSENVNSFAGEPVSASFYYVPTKNYDSGEEPPPPPRRSIHPEQAVAVATEFSYGRKPSRVMAPEFPPETAIYGERPMRDRRRSMYVEEPVYGAHPSLYEPLYGAHPSSGYALPPPRSRMSLPHNPEQVMAALAYGNHRKRSRVAETYEPFAYESLAPDYEDWARPFPKTAPDNFHLSRYGHLQIDYSFSWNSLDRLIRNQ